MIRLTIQTCATARPAFRCCGSVRRAALPSRGERLIGDRLERIDVVKVDAFHFVHVRRHITRHCDIDDEERTVPALTQDWRELFTGEEWLGRRGRGNEDID